MFYIFFSLAYPRRFWLDVSDFRVLFCPKFRLATLRDLILFSLLTENVNCLQVTVTILSDDA